MDRSTAKRFEAWCAVAMALLLGPACDTAGQSGSQRGLTTTDESDPRLPGFTSVDETLQQRLERALASQGSGYVPRAQHINENGSPQFTNRLIEESSPYLLQHAHNPVSWYAWSDEAFKRAKRENKPIFLSIGYSTCHWCHVMERESFENEEIAAFLNRNFISIKVDREERPDIDSVYMTAVNVLAGRSGWPMTVMCASAADASCRLQTRWCSKSNWSAASRTRASRSTPPRPYLSVRPSSSPELCRALKPIRRITTCHTLRICFLPRVGVWGFTFGRVKL